MILIGTSGYSFDDWVGPFYPEGTRRAEMLRFYARHFPVVEINATYYRIPTARTFARMAASTPDGFRFVVKAPRSMTHDREKMHDDAATFREAIAPLREAGKLSGVLLQFPWAFRDSPRSRDHLRRAGDHLHAADGAPTTRRKAGSDDARARRGRPDAPVQLSLVGEPAGPDAGAAGLDAADEGAGAAETRTPVFVEFRHESWDRAEVYAFLEEHRLGYCAVDEPDLPGLMPPVVRATAEDGYVRFHGRNRENWWGRGGGDRYDYLYSEAELRGWTGKIRELAARTRRTFVFFNNCHQGQAVTGARMMARLLEGTDP